MPDDASAASLALGAAAGSGAAGARDLMEAAKLERLFRTQVAATHSDAWLDTCYQRAAGSGEWKSLSSTMYHAVQAELTRRHIDHFSNLSPAEQASIVETVYSNMMATPSKVRAESVFIPTLVLVGCMRLSADLFYSSLVLCQQQLFPTLRALDLAYPTPHPTDTHSHTHRTPHTAHRTPHTAHRTPHTAHRTPHTAHRTSTCSHSTSPSHRATGATGVRADVGPHRRQRARRRAQALAGRKAHGAHDLGRHERLR